MGALADLGAVMAVKPIVVRDESSLVGLLRGRREALGIPQQELDDRIGWPDGYCAKAEAPERTYGRRVAWGISNFLAYWLESLGLALVVMDRAQADALIAASAGDEITESAHKPYGARNRKRDIVQRHVLRMQVSFPAPRQRA